MSPSRSHTRHLTWPPNIHLLPKSMIKTPSAYTTLTPLTTYTQPLPNIAEEEDPFSHFLSPVLEEEEELDPLDGTSYSAGITPYISEPSTAKKDALFRARLEEKWETYVARRLLQHSKQRPGSSSIPAPLPPPFPQTPSTPPGEDALPDLLEEAMDSDTPMSPDESSSPSQMHWYFPSDMSSSDEDVLSDSDGWEADRRRAQSDKPRARAGKSSPSRPKFRSARTLSGKKHAWREPSWDLWTVEEADEEVDDRGRNGRKRRRVHWNEEVTVLEFER